MLGGIANFPVEIQEELIGNPGFTLDYFSLRFRHIFSGRHEKLVTSLDCRNKYGKLENGKNKSHIRGEKVQTPENIRPSRNRRRGKLIVFHIALIPVHRRCGNCTLLIFVGSPSVFPFWCFCLFCSSFFFFFFAQMS